MGKKNKQKEKIIHKPKTEKRISLGFLIITTLVFALAGISFLSITLDPPMFYEKVAVGIDCESGEGVTINGEIGECDGSGNINISRMREGNILAGFLVIVFFISIIGFTWYGELSGVKENEL